MCRTWPPLAWYGGNPRPHKRPAGHLWQPANVSPRPTWPAPALRPARRAARPPRALPPQRPRPPRCTPPRSPAQWSGAGPGGAGAGRKGRGSYIEGQGEHLLISVDLSGWSGLRAKRSGQRVGSGLPPLQDSCRPPLSRRRTLSCSRSPPARSSAARAAASAATSASSLAARVAAALASACCRSVDSAAALARHLRGVPCVLWAQPPTSRLKV